jgi:vacuolar-type H+-ATPase subunit I/STV1
LSEKLFQRVKELENDRQFHTEKYEALEKKFKGVDEANTKLDQIKATLESQCQHGLSEIDLLTNDKEEAQNLVDELQAKNEVLESINSARWNDISRLSKYLDKVHCDMGNIRSMAKLMSSEKKDHS